MGRGLSQQPQLTCSGIADFAAIILATHKAWFKTDSEAISSIQTIGVDARALKPTAYPTLEPHSLCGNVA